MATINKENIFLPSGCLKWEAMQNYQQGGFSNEVRIAIAAHIETCSFCHEALDGLSLIPQTMEQDTYLNSLKEDVNSSIQHKISHTKRKSRSFERIGLLAAAASILLLAGVFTIYTYLLKQGNELIAEESNAKAIPEETIPAEYPVERIVSSEIQANNVPDIPKELVLDEDEDEKISSNIETNTILSKVGGITTDTGLSIDNLDLKSTETGSSIIEEEEIASPAVTSSKKQTEVLLKSVRSSNAAPKMRSEDKMVVDGVEVSVLPRFKSNNYKDFDAYLYSQMKYPPDALSAGKEAEVILTFTISHNGSVKNVQIIKGAEAKFDEEAIRLISNSPNWTPAYSNGRETDHKMQWAIYFKINGSN